MYVNFVYSLINKLNREYLSSVQFNRLLLCCAIALLVNFQMIGGIPSLAQNFSTSSFNFRQPPPPPDAPKGRSRGTGNRGGCDQLRSQIDLISIIPVVNWGLTYTEEPTLWFYIAYSTEESKQNLTARLFLEDRVSDGKNVQQSQQVALPDRSGIFPVRLTTKLRPEQWYRWYLVIICNSEAVSDWEIEGFIYRQNPQMLPDNWERRSSSEKIDFYLENGIWFDLFDQSVSLACSSDDMFWRSSLASPDIQLEDLAVKDLLCDKK